MELFSKNKNRIAAISALLIAAVVAAIFFRHQRETNPLLVSVDGKGVYLKDADARLSEAERTGNSIELKRQMALNIARDKVLASLAAKEGLSVPEFIRKVKSGADIKISDQEFKAYLKAEFPPGKYGAEQLKLYRAGFEERKRDEYFRQFMKKAMADANVRWEH